MQSLYDHLRSYGMGNRQRAKERFFSLSEQRLEAFLSQYTDITRDAPTQAEAMAGATDIYPDSRSALISTDTIKRLSLYANRIYVHDGLIEMSLEWPEIDGMHWMTRIRDREERVELFREELWEKLDFLLEIEPIVTAGIVHLLPTERLYPRRDPNGIYAQDLYGIEGSITGQDGSPQHRLFPDEVRAYLESQIKIELPGRGDQAPSSLEDVTDCPNFVRIMLGDEEAKEFRLFTAIPAEDFSEAGHIRMFHAYDDPFGQEIEPRMFRNWVRGTAKEVMVERVERLHNDTILARHAKARFLTDLPVSLGLLHTDLREDRGIRGILRMELPFFDKVDLKAVAKARQNEASFEDFRIAMEKAVEAIPAETEPQEFQRRLDELSRDLLRVPLLKIKRESDRLTRNVLRQAAMGVGTLGLYCINPTFAISGALFTSATVLAGIYDRNNPSQDKIEDMPGYFYWSVTHRM